MIRRVVLLLPPLLLAAGACGDGGGGSPTSEGTTTTEAAAGGSADASEDEALADRVLLKLSDLPAGYTEGESPTDEPDEEGDPFDQCLSDEAKDLDQATTAEAESPEFSRGDTTNVSSIATVFDSESNAEKAVDLLASDQLKTCLEDALAAEIKNSAGGEEGVEIGDVTLKDASFPNVAEETHALQFGIAVSAQGTELSFYVDMVFFRQGRVLGGLILFNLGDPFPSSEGASAARKMSSRMAA